MVPWGHIPSIQIKTALDFYVKYTHFRQLGMGMRKSSKNRLTPLQEKLFPGHNLFDKIARAVCRAGTLPRKELHEAWEIAKRVRRRYRGGRVLDFACGHGLLGHIMLILDDSSKTAVCVDKKIPINAMKLSHSLIESWPRLKNRIIYKQLPIQDISVLPDDMIVSAHACGSLTDVIIDKAIEQTARVAVLPCCHNLKESSTGNLDGWMDKTLAVDVKRALRLRSKGYKIVTHNIPESITPKNRLLMGKYDLQDKQAFDNRQGNRPHGNSHQGIQNSP